MSLVQSLIATPAGQLLLCLALCIVRKALLRVIARAASAATFAPLDAALVLAAHAPARSSRVAAAASARRQHRHGVADSPRPTRTAQPRFRPSCTQRHPRDLSGQPS
jgi:hypothetical protein